MGWGLLGVFPPCGGAEVYLYILFRRYPCAGFRSVLSISIPDPVLWFGAFFASASRESCDVCIQAPHMGAFLSTVRAV